MRLFLLDSGLRERGSHNLVFALLVGAEARRRGIEVTAFTHRQFKRQADDPFDVKPLFTVSYYDALEGDPVMAPVASFKHLNAHFLKELKTIPKTMFEPSDVVWIPTISQRHLDGLFRWIASFDPATAPQFVVTLTLPPGVATALGTVTVYDSLQALYYRQLLANPRIAPNVHFNATGLPIARDYSFLAQRPVPAHPVLLDPNLQLTPARGRKLLIYVGDAAARKGIQMLPQAFALFAPRLHGWRFLAHVNETGTWSPKRPGAILRSFQEQVPTLEVRSGFHTPDEHRRLFEESSVVLLGYEQEPYSRGMSGVLWEAIAAGRPMILPAGTYLEREAKHWGASFATINTDNPRAIARGVVRVLENNELDFEKAFKAAHRFRAENGVPRFVDYLENIPRPRQEPARIYETPALEDEL